MSVNFDLSSGTFVTQLGATATAGATADRVGWVREAAGDRFDCIELSHTAYREHGDRRPARRGRRPRLWFGLDAEQIPAPVVARLAGR